MTPGVWVCLTGLALAAAARTPLAAQAGSPVDLDRLRAGAAAHPDSFPLVFAYARELARGADERTGAWRARQDARKALDAAYRLRPEDPRVLVELGLLMRKQGFRPDALRILERAEHRAEERDAALTPRERADFHLELALIYEVWWEDAEHYGILTSDFAVGSCAQVASLGGTGMVEPSAARALLLYNVVCPGVFDEVMASWYPPEGHYETDFSAMLRHFRAAAEADTSDPRAALRLLRHLAANDMWEEFLATAEPLARRRPTDPYALMFLGLGYHHAGWRERADSAFTLAVDHADPELRRDMLRPEQLLRRQDSTTFRRLAADRQDVLTDVFWRARDPLFLSDENERLAEHLARLAYVEVAYAQPQSGLRGRWSERGAAWLRWGRPLQIRAMRSPGQETRILEFWDYGAGSPDLVFERTRTYRWARYEELSAEYMRWARDRVPEIYVSEHPRFVADIPFQAAAFRDTARGAVLEIYAAVPGDALRRESHLADLETGVFAVTGDYWEPRAAHRRRLPNTGADTPLDVAFALSPGAYVVSVEASSGDIAARQRERVTVPAFTDTLMLSDLLLTDRFGADTTHVNDRAALLPAVSRSLRFPAGSPIGVVWEIYGLATDSTGAASYNVRAGVADGEQRDAFVRLLDRLFRGGGNLAGVGWDTRRVPRADGTVVEFVSLDLPDARPDTYRLFITVTDHLTGRTFTAHRLLTITRPTP
jgi:GWxTD domain-containing protein